MVQSNCGHTMGSLSRELNARSMLTKCIYRDHILWIWERHRPTVHWIALNWIKQFSDLVFNFLWTEFGWMKINILNVTIVIYRWQSNRYRKKSTQKIQTLKMWVIWSVCQQKKKYVVIIRATQIPIQKQANDYIFYLYHKTLAFDWSAYFYTKLFEILRRET